MGIMCGTSLDSLDISIASFNEKKIRVIGFKSFGIIDSLKKEYNSIHKDIAKKILSVEETNFTTIPMAETLIDNMRNEKNILNEKLDYVNEIDAYISQIRKNYERPLE